VYDEAVVFSDSGFGSSKGVVVVVVVVVVGGGVCQREMGVWSRIVPSLQKQCV
jgi:hypothetical protein